MNYFDLSSEPIESLYQTIAQQMANGIPEAWRSATLVVEMAEDDNALLYGRYTPQDDPMAERNIEGLDHTAYYVAAEIRRRLKKPGEAAWKKALFTLSSEGDFDFDFEYPETESNSIDSSGNDKAL